MVTFTAVFSFQKHFTPHIFILTFRVLWIFLCVCVCVWKCNFLPSLFLKHTSKWQTSPVWITQCTHSRTDTRSRLRKKHKLANRNDKNHFSLTCALILRDWDCPQTHVRTHTPSLIPQHHLSLLACQKHAAVLLFSPTPPFAEKELLQHHCHTSMEWN